MLRRSFLRSVLLPVVVAVSVAGCSGTPTPPPAMPTVGGAITLPDQLRIRVDGQVVSVPIEEYVLGTVLAEIAPANDSPGAVRSVYRLQAIITRTFAAFHPGRHGREGFDLCDSTHCQVYRPGRIRTSRFAAAARQAVADTRGQVLAYGQRPAEALFHADCGGHTAAAEVIWGGRVPYLIGTADAVAVGTHRSWQFTVTREQLRTALNATAATVVGSALRSMRIASRDTSGRAATLELVGDIPRTLRGEQVRAAVNQRHGAMAIRSTKFSLTLVGDAYQFDGTGWGHGVGLCQVGAMARIRRGDDVAAVLSAYYPGARLVRAF
jgi:stage II sporulation protein D